MSGGCRTCSPWPTGPFGACGAVAACSPWPTGPLWCLNTVESSPPHSVLQRHTPPYNARQRHTPPYNAHQSCQMDNVSAAPFSNPRLLREEPIFHCLCARKCLKRPVLTFSYHLWRFRGCCVGAAGFFCKPENQEKKKTPIANPIFLCKSHKKPLERPAVKRLRRRRNYFFLCLIILSFFFLLWVAILCFFLFLPQGTAELLISPWWG